METIHETDTVSGGNGNILIDIAFSYENSVGIHDATNKSGNVKFKVYRNGW